MKKLVRLTLVLTIVLTFLCASASAKVPEGWFQGGANFMKAMEMHVKLNVPLVIYFYVDWCPYCHELEREYFPTAAMREYLRGVIKIRINPELTAADREIAQLFRVRGYPSFFVAAPDGSPIRVSPYLRNGRTLSPAEFAARCREAGASRTTAKVTEAPAATASAAPAATAPATAAAPVKVVSNGPLPTADAVLTKYAQVTTGATMQGRMTSRVIKGRINVPGLSSGGRFEFYATAGGKSLTVMNVEPLGVVRQGFDGVTGWTSAENASKAGNIPELALVAAADFYRDVKLNELYPKTKLLGKVSEGDREVYMVEAAPRTGAPETLYFDAQTGLLAHRDFTRGSARGPIQSEIYFSDWRNVDGFRLPCSMTQMIGNLTLVITIDEIRHNVALDDAMFRRPVR